MFEIIDEENILRIDLDGENIHNFPKLETSLSINGDNLVIEYENENVQIPYTQCSDPSEASVENLYTEVLAILNNVPTGGSVDTSGLLKRDGTTTGATAQPQEFTNGTSTTVDGGNFYLQDATAVNIVNTVENGAISANTQGGKAVLKATKADGTGGVKIDSDGRINDVKVYRALLSQTGTDAPVATILENTLDETPGYTYDTTGRYFLQTVGSVFTANKTYVTIDFSHANDPTESFNFIRHKLGSTQQITIVTNSLDLGGAATPAADGILDQTEIQILVYP